MNKRNKEQRGGNLPSTTRIAIRKKGNGRVATGYAIVFAPAVSQDLGGFIETVNPSAIDLKRNNIWCFFGHDDGRILGSTDSGTLRLTKDMRGIKFEVDLPDTTDGNDLVELLSRGDGGQCSFGFLTNDDDWKVLADGVVLRTLLDIDVFEISIGVAIPAYADTSSALRSAPKSIREKIKGSKKRDDGIRAADADDDNACECECDSCAAGDCEECSYDGCLDERCLNCPNQSISEDDPSERAALLTSLLLRRTR